MQNTDASPTVVVFAASEVLELLTARAQVRLGLSPDDYEAGKLRLLVADGNLVRAELVLVRR